MDAADYAIQMARKYNAEVIALNVILSYVTIFGPTVLEYLERIREKFDENSANNVYMMVIKFDLEQS